MNISGLLSTVDAVKISENRDRDAIILVFCHALERANDTDSISREGNRDDSIRRFSRGGEKEMGDD